MADLCHPPTLLAHRDHRFPISSTRQSGTPRHAVADHPRREARASVPFTDPVTAVPHCPVARFVGVRYDTGAQPLVVEVLGATHSRQQTLPVGGDSTLVPRVGAGVVNEDLLRHRASVPRKKRQNAVEKMRRI